jgi:hypothetical protein
MSEPRWEPVRLMFDGLWLDFADLLAIVTTLIAAGLAGVVYLGLPEGRRHPWVRAAVLNLALSPLAMILLGRLAMHPPFPSPPSPSPLSPLAGVAQWSIVVLLLIEIPAMALLGEFAVRGIERWRWPRLGVLAILGLMHLAVELFAAMIGVATISGVWF